MATACRWCGIICWVNDTSWVLWLPCAAEPVAEGSAEPIAPVSWPERPDEDDGDGEEDSLLLPQAASATAAVAAVASAAARRMRKRRDAMRRTTPLSTRAVRGSECRQAGARHPW
ncbi:hypothetical protein GCM10010365_45130 [Streptomyces poonensis]|uniref:Uncharacterized protein n=1 Tax=Streptomyces poonensis TaxID=68255 RepID=A0A918PR32_9ACTN|nr:hypothetical protein GCM10010365_45130 [Streptomyces poonensis]